MNFKVRNFVMQLSCFRSILFVSTGMCVRVSAQTVEFLSILHPFDLNALIKLLLL